MSIRSSVLLPLRLAPAVWKQIVCQNVTIDDILGVDLLSFNMAEAMMESSDCDQFDMTFDQTFTGVTADQRLCPLVPYGKRIKVTYGLRSTYSSLLRDFRNHEFREQVDLIRKGMADVVPKTALMLFDGPELEKAVCGVNSVDIALLKRHTVYQGGYSQSALVIQYFWEVMENRFDNELRQKYLQFVWGRSRLPIDEMKWEHPMKISRMNRADPDRVLPVSHTCFFQLDLPEYTNAETLYQRLKVAIESCSVFDMG
uniref:HECT domain-containing protein n=1 Tax=Lotharella globosa TaxID=91324 RepID=A0A7S3ZES9_9EUKA|mmetsp:Transcript_38236/g.73539  ORF Transcript_38236/g.73539 Transcript_38236/m.73539 type:complete len:256 (+) Transcript_38236:3-770(+)